MDDAMTERMQTDEEVAAHRRMYGKASRTHGSTDRGGGNCSVRHSAVCARGLSAYYPEEWGQYTYFLKGVEAIALAAVGFLFGKEVNSERAEAAEARAKDAQQQLEKVRARNTAGAAQVEALAALAKRKGTRAKLLETGHRERTQLGPDEISDLLVIARKSRQSLLNDK